MIELFSLIAICSIWNLGIEIVLSEGMALHNLRLWAESKKSKWYEVGIWCLWCRPSLHSIISYIVAAIIGVVKWDSWNVYALYPLVVAGSSLASGLIWSLYKLIEIKIKYYNHMEQHEYFNLKERKEFYYKNKK